MVSARDVYVAIFGVMPEQDWAQYQSILEGRRNQANHVAKTLSEMGYHKVISPTPKGTPQPRIIPKVPSDSWFEVEGTNYQIFHQQGHGVDFEFDPVRQTITGPGIFHVRHVP